MPHKSPFTREIFDAWDKLVLNNGDKLTLDQRFAGWQNLHAMCLQNGKWIVGFMDASLAASLGYYLAMEKKDWTNARLLANKILAHPEANNFPNDPHLSSAHGIEIAAGILCGDLDASIKKSLRLIDEKFFGRWSKAFLQCSIGHLSDVLHELTPSGVLDPKLQDYAFELMKRFPGFKKRAKEVLTMTSNQEVMDWIDAIMKENWERNKAAWTKSVKCLHPEFEG